MNNQLKSGVYLSYISIFITNITNLVLTPFIVRNLGQSQYGLYMLIGALIGYIAVLDFGLGNTTVRYVAKYRAEKEKEKEENFLFMTFSLYAIISIIVVIIGAFIFINLDRIFTNSLSIEEIKIAKTMFIILMINLAITLPMKSFTGIINAYEKFSIPRLLTIFRILVRAVLILIFLSIGYKAIAIVLIDTILNMIMMAMTMGYVFVKLKVKIKLHSYDKVIMKQIISFSSLIFLSVIVDQFYWRIGHLVLGIVASSSEVGVFAIGMTIGQYFITFSTAISGVFLPKITSMVVKKATGEELTDLLIKTGRIQYLILGLILTGFILFGHKFIVLWVGPSYSISWAVSLLVIIPLIIVLTQTIGISILQAKNMHGFRAVAYLGISLVNLVISIFAAKSYGAIGAAVGTTLSLIFGNIIVMNLYYHYKVGLNMLRFFKELSKGLLLSSLISIVIGTFLLFVPNYSWLALLFQCLIYSIIYIIVMWFLGMNNYEKKLFKMEILKVKNVFMKG